MSEGAIAASQSQNNETSNNADINGTTTDTDKHTNNGNGGSEGKASSSDYRGDRLPTSSDDIRGEEPKQISYPKERVISVFGSIGNAPTIINESDRVIILKSEDAGKQGWTVMPVPSGLVTLDIPIDGLATHASTDQVFKVWDGGKIYIDPDGNVGVTYEGASMKEKAKWVYGKLTGYPEGWQYPSKHNNMTGDWFLLRDLNRTARRLGW